MSDDDDTCIVAMRCEDGESAVNDSLVVPCSDCGKPCWVSPRSFEQVPTARVECTHCALPRIIAAGPDVTILPPSDATKREVVDELRRRHGGLDA